MSCNTGVAPSSQHPHDNTLVRARGNAREAVGWPSGLRRQFQALVSSEAWVRIPLQSRFFASEQDFDLSETNNKKMPRLGIAPRLLQPQCRVLLLYYLGVHFARIVVTGWNAELQNGVRSHNYRTATLAKRLMRLPRKQKVVSSNLTGGSFFAHCWC